MTTLAVVQDHVVQRGGAERVLGAIARAFPEATIHTSVFDPDLTYPELGDLPITASAVNRVGFARRHHRALLPLFPLIFETMRLDAPVVLCHSAGWAHTARAKGRKIVYFQAPPRWLYQTDAYLRGSSRLARTAVRGLLPFLRWWDVRRGRDADRYFVNSRHIQGLVERCYGVRAELLPPPLLLDPSGTTSPVQSVEPGFVLCVSRLLPYKNVDRVVDAFGSRSERLVVVGSGPLEARLRDAAGPNVTFIAKSTDAELRWLYDNSAGLVAPSQEDFGLTPVEAAAFGRPTAALRWGGYLDTVAEGRTGVFFDRPTASDVNRAVDEMLARDWERRSLREHARSFSESAFVERLRAVVEEETAMASRHEGR